MSVNAPFATARIGKNAMGSSLFDALLSLFGLRKLSLLLAFLLLAACGRHATVTDGVSFEKVTSFGPPGDGFLQSVDWPAREFHFVRVILCPEPADAMCRILRHDVYRFDDNTQDASKITSRIIDKEEFGNAYPDTEQKRGEIIKFLQKGDGKDFKHWETFEVSAILKVEAQYRIRWHSLERRLHVRTPSGDLIDTIEARFGNLHRLFHFPGTDGWTYIFLDGRSCGASACAGYVHVYRARKNE